MPDDPILLHIQPVRAAAAVNRMTAMIRRKTDQGVVSAPMRADHRTERRKRRRILPKRRQ